MLGLFASKMWRGRPGIAIACVLLSMLGACGPDTTAQAGPEDLFYVLQPENVSVAELTAAGFHWLILEPSRDGSAATEFSSTEIGQIRSAGPCRKNVLAYLSIGEAEDYRDYWDPNWVDANGDPVPGVAPAWLGPVDPDWPGNYKVRYWDPDWHAILFGTPSGPGETPLDRIIDAGFDGVYLDIIDAYEFWGPEGDGHELDRMTARAYMIDLVEAIANYARVTRGVSDFLVFPQNASDIIRDDDDGFDTDTDRYFAAISGIGQEDLYYNELSPQPAAETQYTLAQLREFAARGKTVLVTDYVIDASNPSAANNDGRVSDLYTRCRNEGFVPYAAMNDRDLDEIVAFSGSGWTFAQPAPGCPDCTGDLNGDAVVDLGDLSILLANYNAPSGMQYEDGDLDGDGDVDLGDLSAMLAVYGESCT